MIAPALARLVAAAPPVSLAFPGLNSVGLAQGEGELYAELLAQKLQAYPLKVITTRDIGAALGLERQKELMDCADTGCVAELSGALGADGIVVGDVGKLDQSYAVNFKVLSKEGQTLAIFNAAGAKASELPGVIAEAARALAHQLAGALGRPELEPTVVVAPAPLGPTSLRRAAWVPLGVAALALVVGAIGQVVATVKLDAIAGAETLALAALYRDQGKKWEAAGNAFVAIAATALTAGIVLYVLSARDVTPGVSVVPGGASLGVSGAWP